VPDYIGQAFNNVLYLTGILNVSTRLTMRHTKRARKPVTQMLDHSRQLIHSSSRLLTLLDDMARDIPINWAWCNPFWRMWWLVAICQSL